MQSETPTSEMLAQAPTREQLSEWYKRSGRSSTDLAYFRADPDPEVFFSEEVYENVVDHVLALILARMLSSYEETGGAPKFMRVNVGVEVAPTAPATLEVVRRPE